MSDKKEGIVLSEKFKAEQARRQARKREKWFKREYKVHGSTEPDDLEGRRQKLTVIVKGMEKVLERVGEAMKDPKSMSLEDQKQLSNDLKMFTLSYRFASIEALCQIIDALTIRIEVVDENTRKKLYTRFPAIAYLANTCDASQKTAKILQLIAELPDDDE